MSQPFKYTHTHIDFLNLCVEYVYVWDVTAFASSISIRPLLISRNCQQWETYKQSTAKAYWTRRQTENMAANGRLTLTTSWPFLLH